MLPRPLALLLLAGGVIPALAAALVLAGQARRIGLTNRLTLAAFGVFGLGVGVMASSATLAVLRVGLHERYASYLPVTVSAATDVGLLWQQSASPVAGIAPQLALLRSAHPAVGFAALLRLHCDTGCTVATDADRPTLRPLLARAARTTWAGQQRSVLAGGRLLSIVPAAVRDREGVPIAVLLLGVGADGARGAGDRVAIRAHGVGAAGAGLGAHAEHHRRLCHPPGPDPDRQARVRPAAHAESRRRIGGALPGARRGHPQLSRAGPGPERTISGAG